MFRSWNPSSTALPREQKIGGDLRATNMVNSKIESLTTNRRLANRWTCVGANEFSNVARESKRAATLDDNPRYRIVVAVTEP